MPRAADAYGAFYHQSRMRLLHQVYAYVGNTELAQRALSDAYVAAGHHWRKVSALADPDAWMREQAFAASKRAQNRPRRPWFENAKHTAEDHRGLLSSLGDLPDADRHLLIVHYLVGKDVATAAREVGLTDSAAQLSLDTSRAALQTAGIDPSTIPAALDRLRSDLQDEPADRAVRLRREGNRRRRSHTVLAGLTVVAVAIGAGALTATHGLDDEGTDIAQGPGSGPEIADPEAPPTEAFTVESLAPVEAVERLDPGRTWRVTSTSADFGDSTPVSECLQITPSEQRTAHYWVREFTGGGGGNPVEVTESLQVARAPQAADASYAASASALSTCRGGQVARRLQAYQSLRGVGDGGSIFDYEYSLPSGLVRERIVVVHTGLAVVTWVIRDSASFEVPAGRIARLAADSVNALCMDAEGSCSESTYEAVTLTPPAPDNNAAGFLGDVDLPLFEGITEPWVATSPRAARTNPAATQCAEADFAGARDARSRSFVIPDEEQLPTIFGMTEMRGTFRSSKAARQFTSLVERRFDTCEDRELNIAVGPTSEFDEDGVHGQIWEVEQAASEDETFLFRIAVVRVGGMVAQVTFTPGEGFDVSRDAFTELAVRAGSRLRQS